jgi:hypothetical protein
MSVGTKLDHEAVIVKNIGCGTQDFCSEACSEKSFFEWQRAEAETRRVLEESSDKEKCSCCREFIGEEGGKLCSCDTGACPNCQGRNNFADRQLNGDFGPVQASDEGGSG